MLPVINEAVTTGLETEWVTGTLIWIQDVSYWLPDIEALRIKVAHIQGIAVDERWRNEIESLVHEYKRSVPREIKEKMKVPSKAPSSMNTSKKL